jgi:TatD DNase family protein
MRLIDSHAHLQAEAFAGDLAAVVGAAREAGVERLLAPGWDLASSRAGLDLAARVPGIPTAAGIHPHAAAGADDEAWTEVARLASDPRVVALGETGLDYYHDQSLEGQSRQRERFAWQLALAARERLPVVIHTRQAEADTLDLIRRFPGVVGVLHCFTESWELAAAALDQGYYVSISGIVTFRNAENVREVALRVPDDRLLVETDCPWLAPVPHRGRPNQPAYVADTAAFLAQLRGTTAEELAATTTANFRRLFARTAGPHADNG